MAKGKEMNLAVSISGRVDKSFTSAIGAATNSIGSFAGGLAKVSGAALAGGMAALGGLAAKATEVGKSFETAMSQVSATMLIDKSTEEGKKSFETLEAAAEKCGENTAFSATQAAEALNYLALAGYDADKAATALPTILNLAGAGAMDLAAASDMVTDSMSALGIKATETNLNAFADGMAMTASKSNTSVAQLGEAILTVGGTAKSLAGGTVELNTALGILADNGIKGAEGGTALRNVMLSLQSPTDKAADQLKALGINVYDADGNMRPLNDTLNDFNSAMNGMTNAEKDQILTTVFNKRDLKSVNALLANSSDRWNELSGEIKNAGGACEEMYKTQMDNLEGDMASLNSAIEALGITAYKTFEGELRDAVGIGTDSIKSLNAAAKEGGLEGLAQSAGGVVANIVTEIANRAPELINLSATLITSLAEGLANAAPQLVPAVFGIAGALVNGILTIAPQILSLGGTLLMNLAQGIISNLPMVLNTASIIITNLIQGISTQLPALLNTGLTIILGLVQGIADSLPTVATCALNIVTSLIMGLLPALPNVLNMGTQIVNTLVNGVISTLSAIVQLAPTIIKTLITGLIQNLPAIIIAAVKMGTEIPMNLAIGVIQALPDIAMAVFEIQTIIWDTLLNTDWLALGEQIIDGVLDGIATNASKIGDAVMGVVTGKGTGSAGAKTAGTEMATELASGFDIGSADLTSSLDSLTKNAFANIDTSSALSAGSAMSDDFLSGLMTPTNTEIDLSALTAGVETQFTELGTTAGLDLTSGLTTQFTDSQPELDTAVTGMTDSMNTQFTTGFTNIKTTAQTAMTELTNLVTTEAQKAADAVKQAFEGMTITIPKPKIPQITATFSKVEDGMGGSVNVPNFSVNWNALGGIFDRATVFNTSQGLQGAGERGPEALLPLDSLWSHLEGAMSGAGGMNISYSPSYTINGNSDDFTQAAASSQKRFEKMMEEYEKKRSRINFSRW